LFDEKFRLFSYFSKSVVKVSCAGKDHCDAEFVGGGAAQEQGI